jgi:hypothetical protein
MSATVTTREARVPVTRFGGPIAAVMIAIALAAAIGIAALAYVLRDTGPAPSFDATNALRQHVVREYGSSATYDATNALSTHVLRENSSGAAAGGSTVLFDHVLRENGAD